MHQISPQKLCYISRHLTTQCVWLKMNNKAVITACLCMLLHTGLFTTLSSGRPNMSIRRQACAHSLTGRDENMNFAKRTHVPAFSFFYSNITDHVRTLVPIYKIHIFISASDGVSASSIMDWLVWSTVNMFFFWVNEVILKWSLVHWYRTQIIPTGSHKDCPYCWSLTFTQQKKILVNNMVDIWSPCCSWSTLSCWRVKPMCVI